MDLGTAGLIVQVQSRKETYTDKLIAFALRNRIKACDIWDILWLRQSLDDTSPVHLGEKINEHHRTISDFLSAYEQHLDLVKNDPEVRKQYLDEMGRFLPPQLLATVQNPEFWNYTAVVLEEELDRCRRDLSGTVPRWKM